MRILFVAAEVAPFARTGSLADVAGSLPQALRRLGHEVRIVLPLYRAVRASGIALHKSRRSIRVRLGASEHKVLLRQAILDGIPVYFLEQDDFFDRDGIYGEDGQDYPDNALRFGFFSKACLELLKRLDFRPDLLHLNDWPTALIAVLLRLQRGKDPFYAPMGTLLTIHDLGYQGLFPFEELAPLGLPPELFTDKQCEYYGRFSFLKGGIQNADLISTVSPSYCREIQQQESGLGFEGILRQRGRDLSGIRNGIELKNWDPALDTCLAAPFHAGALTGKNRCRKKLQELFALGQDGETALVAVLGKNAPGMGLELLEEGWDRLMELPLQLVLLLPSGEEADTGHWLELCDRYPGRVALKTEAPESLLRQSLAGADLLLIPGRREPGGQSGLLALRYGTIPIARRSGALADILMDPSRSPRRANGFTFEEATADSMLGALDRALEHRKDRRTWKRLMRRAMELDLSWEGSARQYLELYRRAAGLKAQPCASSSPGVRPSPLR